jgi:hypothetical protein
MLDFYASFINFNLIEICIWGVLYAYTLLHTTSIDAYNIILNMISYVKYIYTWASVSTPVLRLCKQICHYVLLIKKYTAHTRKLLFYIRSLHFHFMAFIILIYLYIYYTIIIYKSHLVNNSNTAFASSFFLKKCGMHCSLNDSTYIFIIIYYIYRAGHILYIQYILCYILLSYRCLCMHVCTALYFIYMIYTIWYFRLK